MTFSYEYNIIIYILVLRVGGIPLRELDDILWNLCRGQLFCVGSIAMSPQNIIVPLVCEVDGNKPRIPNSVPNIFPNHTGGSEIILQARIMIN